MAKQRKDYSERLRKNYKRLREAGFSSKEATRYRGASEENIQKAIASKTLPEKSVHHVQARKGKKRTRKKTGWRNQVEQPEGIKGRITQYEIVHRGDEILYNRSYSYVVWFVTVDAEGIYTPKWLILTSDTPLSKKEIVNQMYEEIFTKHESLYEGERIIRESITITRAIHNPRPGVGI